LVFRPARDVGEERVTGVEYDESHRTGAAGAQLACGVVAHVAEFADGLMHAGDDGIRHSLGPVEHVRDGADGDAGTFGDVAYGGCHPSLFSPEPHSPGACRNDSGRLDACCGCFYCSEHRESFQRGDSHTMTDLTPIAPLLDQQAIELP